MASMTPSSGMPDPALLIALLGDTPGFSGLSQPALAAIAAGISVCALSQGQPLANQGDPGNALFLVVSGSLALTRQYRPDHPPLHLGTVAAGEITGELSLLTGHPRDASIHAAEPTVVGVLSKESFEQVAAHFPEEISKPLDWMAARLHQYQVANAIADSQVLLELETETREALAASFQTKDLPAGQILFHEGEQGDALYLILSGRVRIEIAVAPSEEFRHSTRVLAELGKGDLLGEMALLTGEPRSATAIAVRDTQLAELQRSAFDRIVAAHPQQMLGLVSRQLAGRLRAQNAGRKAEGRPPVSIAVLTPAGSADPTAAPEFARELVRQLSLFGPTLHLNSTILAGIFGRDPFGATQSSTPSHSSTSGQPSRAAFERRLLSWLGDQEMTYRHVVYEADPDNSPWTSRCLRQADLVLAVIDADADQSLCAQLLSQLVHAPATSVPRTLVLLHSGNGNTMPANTARTKRLLAMDQHRHVRRNTPADVGRIAREINHQSVGLTLGGGFALGLAHIGVIDAMRHLDIPIDFVGGTSMGAIIGVACAQEFSHAQMLEVMDKGCAQALKGDYTLPIVSLLTGKKVTLALGKYLSGLDIEDLWLPYFAISASLVQARMVVHRTGSALHSVLASCRAPGMFPPLGWNGDVLVDGGLVNNIPADVMRECVGGGTVFAADVSPKKEFSAGSEFGMNVSGWRVAARNANPFRRAQRIGTIGDILMRMIRLGGVAHNREIQSRADLYFALPLERFSIRDFHLGEEMAQVGYEYALRTLQEWIAVHGRPWQGQPASGNTSAPSSPSS